MKQTLLIITLLLLSFIAAYIVAINIAEVRSITISPRNFPSITDMGPEYHQWRERYRLLEDSIEADVSSLREAEVWRAVRVSVAAFLLGAAVTMLVSRGWMYVQSVSHTPESRTTR